MLAGTTEPFVSLYFQSQWTPLVLFFLMYLYVIRNNKLHHFMRFYCMQACPQVIATICQPARHHGRLCRTPSATM